MHESIDQYDQAILRALKKDGALTNAQLSEMVNLSPSQCSRRRLRLEKEGIIAGYHARLNDEAMGLGLRAVIRVNLNSHSEKNAKEFSGLLNSHDEIIEAFSVSGDADYILIVQCKDLASFSDFIHTVLLPQPIIGQVKSEIALKEIKQPHSLHLPK
tara:strand:+ start:2495 stop:2965 length:471 start_codon:yes stop_codon:yes gene_type:complete